MKARFIATAIVFVFLFTVVNTASFAQDKNVKQQVKGKTEKVKKEVKSKTETMKTEVKTKADENMKTQTELATKKGEQTKEKVKHLKTHKSMTHKSKMKETKPETK